MELDISCLDIIKKLGGSAFCIYVYVGLKQKKDWCNFYKIEELKSKLNLSRNTVIDSIKLLRKHKYLLAKKVIEDGKKRLFLKIISPDGAKIDQKNAYPNILSKLIYNKSNKTKKDNKNRKIYKDVMLKLLSHPRYDNQYYKNRKWKFGEREEKHITNLVSQIGENDIGNYIEWWLRNKASRISGLSIGIVVCQPMLEEYKIKYKKQTPIVEKRKSSVGEKEKQKIHEMNINLSKEVIREYKAGKELNKTDKEFIDEMVKAGIIVKNKNTMELAHGIK